MSSFGLLGEKLSHSYSPKLHSMLGDYSYDLFEVEKNDVESFIRSGKWEGLNVTIPYKKTVFSFIDELSEDAGETGCVNTVVRRNGVLYGDNTDVYGFKRLVAFSGIDVANKKAVVLGSGGASAAACAALRSMGSVPVVISRHGPDNYMNLSAHRDAQIVVNTTPVGMFPYNGQRVIDLNDFPDCIGVLDVIYNPRMTALLMDAEKKNIPRANGLYMLVAQAKRSAELFAGKVIPDREVGRIYAELDRSMRNIVLVGMPGCGKTTAASEIGRLTGRKVIDTDSLFEARNKMTPAQYIVAYGEPAFRLKEHEIVIEAGSMSGAVIATGGGVVTFEKNYEALHQNGIIIWLQRSPDKLCTQGRPLSVSKSLEDLYSEREDLYRKFADCTVDLDRENYMVKLLRIVSGVEE